MYCHRTPNNIVLFLSSSSSLVLVRYLGGPGRLLPPRKSAKLIATPDWWDKLRRRQNVNSEYRSHVNDRFWTPELRKNDDTSSLLWYSCQFHLCYLPCVKSYNLLYYFGRNCCPSLSFLLALWSTSFPTPSVMSVSIRSARLVRNNAALRPSLIGTLVSLLLVLFLCSGIAGKATFYD